MMVQCRRNVWINDVQSERYSGSAHPENISNCRDISVELEKDFDRWNPLEVWSPFPRARLIAQRSRPNDD